MYQLPASDFKLGAGNFLREEVIKMKNKGFTLVEIMIVVAIIALLAAIAIPNLMRAKIVANQAAAMATLKTISTSCETFAAANNGTYPNAMASLTGATPPYLNANPIGNANGYTYAAATQTIGAYTFTAVPVTLNSSGNDSYSICTGGVLRTAAGTVTAPGCP